MQRLEKTRAFLTEFIIVILFFTISSITVIKLYVAANENIDDSIILNKTSLMCETLCEEIKAYSDFQEEDGIIYDLMINKKGYIRSEESIERYYQYFDEDLEVCNKENGKFISYITVKKDEMQAGDLYKIEIVFKSSNTEYGKAMVSLYDSKEVD